MAKSRSRYVMLINLDRCIGCSSCTVSCNAAYTIPFGMHRCKVETRKSGDYPELKKSFVPLLCNHCDSAPCIDACQEGALVKSKEGVVLLSSEKCTQCHMCYETCPYEALSIHPDSGAVEKCDFCYSRLLDNASPVCVSNCMGNAMFFGDALDSRSEVARLLEQHRHMIRKPELGTSPSVYYISRREILPSDIGIFQPSQLKPTRRISVPVEAREDRNVRTVYTSDAMCPSECGIIVHVEDNIAKRISGNSSTLINNGALCAKGAAGLQLTYSPDRIRTPLMRTDDRGADRWKAVSWEEASDYIAGRLIDLKRRFGPESVFVDCGDVTDREAYYRLFHAYGTPNIYNHGSICDPNRRWGQGIMTGDERPLPDIQRPFLMRDENGELNLHREHDIKLLVHIGANPLIATRFNYMSKGIPAAKESGCTYIVVDPSHTHSAAHADMWIPIIPGTDAALLAGMLYYIVTHDNPSNASRRYLDHAFIDTYTSGWADFLAAFLAQAATTDSSNGYQYFSPEWTEARTGIPKDRAEKLFDLFGITKPAAIEIGMHGTAHHTNGDVTSILMTALCLITGNMDIPGGLVFTDSTKPKRGEKASGFGFLKKAVSRIIQGSEISAPVSALHKDLFGSFPAAWKGVLTDLPEKIMSGVSLKHGPFKGHTYPVKAIICRAGNPVMTAGNTAQWKKALTTRGDHGDYLLELSVFIDTHLSDTGRYADIVLPEAGFLERMGVSDVYTHSPEISLRDRAINPLHQSKSPYEIMIELSSAMIRNGDPDIAAEDFSERYADEETFIDDILSEAPGLYNVGTPLPYPDLPEGCYITGSPDNPNAFWGKTKIKNGELLTAGWLRKNKGVAIWPASYYRYKQAGNSPSGIYPQTASHTFEFRFSYIREINTRLGTQLPETFYWSECRWNPKSPDSAQIIKEYPFQLISGRVHHAMTMTAVCPGLAEIATECMQQLNDSFTYFTPAAGAAPNCSGLRADAEHIFTENSIAIPVFAIHRKEGRQMGLNDGDLLIVENPMGMTIKGKAFLTEEVMPGVIKTAFGPGGQKSSGMGFMSKTAEYTEAINNLHDPENLSPYTGMPGFGDIMVKVRKAHG